MAGENLQPNTKKKMFDLKKSNDKDKERRKGEGGLKQRKLKNNSQLINQSA
eukprot:m.59099 g.59099  ORF g.59099 m.59099 type:complete len:51 (+) comp7898_c0_seq1:1048-1200(+)